MSVKGAAGTGGKVQFPAPTEILDVRTWSVDQTADNQRYVSSSTAGQAKRETGNKDWTSTISIYLQDGATTDFNEGEKGSLILTSTTGTTWTGDAICDSVAPDVDIEAGAIISATCVFSADGALTKVTPP